VRWELPQAEPAADLLAAELGIGAPAARTLAGRGFRDLDSARRFLHPSMDELTDPLMMRDMARAAARIETAIRKREKILVYGDYDVDGATAVSLLVKSLEIAGGDVAWHVPHRLKDGYGMRAESVDAALSAGVKLIVSVDTGIRAGEVVRRAAESGIDVIVTDHHLPESELPPAVAVLNPNRPDCEYPEKNLCGAAVAFKLAQAVFAQMGWPAERLCCPVEVCS
jgi:single-stranded-DNA-specific exonuclease